MEQRFIIVEGSLSGHCCFEFSIVDTAAGKTDYSTNDGFYWNLSMCECFERQEAETICNALNQHHAN